MASASTSPAGPRPKRRVAVVGTGVAGLTTAYLLNRQGDAEVTVFEREAAIGIDSQSVQVGNGRVDVPLRVFSRTFYPNLAALYNELGVKYEDADYSFLALLWRAATERDEAVIFHFFRIAGVLWLPSVEALREGGTRLCRLLFDMVRFLVTARMQRPPAGETVEQHLTRRGFSKEFKTKLLYPMFAVVCTCTFDSVANYPADVAFGYWSKHSALFDWPWYKRGQCRVIGGIAPVAKQLAHGSHRIRLGTKVVRVNAGGKGDQLTVNNQGKREVLVEAAPSPDPSVTFEDSDGQLKSESFDAVVLATQAHHALALLAAPTPAQQRALGSFVYEQSRVITHRDRRLMPNNTKLWSPLNIMVDPQSESNMPMCSVWMSRVNPKVDVGVFQTWNPLIEPRKELVLSDSWFERPVVTVRSGAAMEELAQQQGEGGLHFVGAYSLYAVPLLENGVRSAMQVAASLGADTSWRPRPAGAMAADRSVHEAGEAAGAAGWSLPKRLVLATATVLGATGVVCLIGTLDRRR